ncbi:MAG: TraM recognition domain-containing protein [Candidatus Dojkabacteria bacterium]|nr:TraM recognition domain-containing protein [Candidatus Dojkabacteria bacterium]
MNQAVILVLLICIGIVVLIIFYIALYILVKSLKEELLKLKSLNLVYFEVKLPQSNDVEIKAAEQMYAGLITIADKLKNIRKLLSANNFVSFEIVAFKESIRFFVVCPKKIAGIVDRNINGSYPLAEIQKVKEYNLFKENAFVSYAMLKQVKDPQVPLQSYEFLPVDPLSAITDSMSKLVDDEAACIQVVITPVDEGWRNKVKEYVKQQREKLSKEKDENNSKPNSKKIDEEAINMIDNKISKPNFYTDLRIVVVSKEKYAAELHINNILSTFNPLSKEGGNKLQKINDENLKRTIVYDFIYRIPRKTMILNTSELATIYHFPNKNIKTPHIKWLLSKSAPAPDFVTNYFDDHFMYLGKNTHRGISKEIFIKPEDRLRHFYVIGQTGTGKSKFMSGMMIRDIKLGHGCCWIDPHGTDAETILQQIPPERVDDVIFFDPSDTERPFGLNMLEFDSEGAKTRATDELLNIFDILFDLRTTGGPIFEQYFRYGILLLTEDPESGSTLLDFPRIFIDQGYREYKLSKAKNPEVIDFWRKQAEKANRDLSLENLAPYITSKLAPMITNAYVRPIVAQQKSTIDFRKAMDESKIIICKFSKGKIGDRNTNLLGMIVVGKILVNTLERESVDESKRTPFYLYIDEFQNFLTNGILTILSEARKYKLGLVVGHQYLGQLVRNGNTQFRDAIFGNVGNKMFLRVGPDDSAFLLKELQGSNFEEQDLRELQNATGIAKILVDGKPTPAFTLRSYWGESPYDMISEPNFELAEEIKKISKLRYGRDRDLIEQEIVTRSKFTKQANTDKGSKSLSTNVSDNIFGF